MSNRDKLGSVQMINRSRIFFLVGVSIVLLLAGIMLPPVQKLIREKIPNRWKAHLNSLRFNYEIDNKIRIRMVDGVELASTLYLPRNNSKKLATILVQQPYNRLEHGEGIYAGDFFARNGYAVMIQDIRGKFASQGEFMPYQSGVSDGAATLDWIVQQPWSNGRVGTFGCSGLGELQFTLSKAKHPAHRAMIPLGAGGAVGSAGGNYSYFGLFEGGVFQLASGFGWFLENGAKSPRAAPLPKNINIMSALSGLPVADMVKRIRPEPNAFEEFVRTPLTDKWWDTLGYISDAELPTIPALVISTWGDQTVGATLSLAELVRKSSPEIARNQHVIIAPGTHCHAEESGLSGKFGVLDVPGAVQPYEELYLRWFDYWLRDREDGLASMPRYVVYVIGEQRWLEASQWPPQNAKVEKWYLDSGGHANGRRGDGVLSTSVPTSKAGYDEFRYDPMHPVPTRGGPACCTGMADEKQGPTDQLIVEERNDVLVYTSAKLAGPLRIAGPLFATLKISSSALDTDYVVRLTHVWPDGRSTNIQEGALRARYRNGIKHPSLLEPGKPVTLRVDARSIAYTIPVGHQLRLQVTSSSFPRLERNLNTGGRNFDEVVSVVATNRVHHNFEGGSYLELPILHDD